MLGRGDLRWLLLARIAEEPCHGYELIRRVSELFAGTTRPARAWCTRPWRSWKPPAGWPRTATASGACTASRRPGRPRWRRREQLDEVLLRTRQRARGWSRPTCRPRRANASSAALHRRHGRWSEADIARVAAAMERVAEALERDGDD
jgi:hypothetical protein